MNKLTKSLLVAVVVVGIGCSDSSTNGPINEPASSSSNGNGWTSSSSVIPSSSSLSTDPSSSSGNTPSSSGQAPSSSASNGGTSSGGNSSSSNGGTSSGGASSSSNNNGKLTQFGTVTASRGGTDWVIPGYSTSGTPIVCGGERAEFGPLSGEMLEFVHPGDSSDPCFKICSGDAVFTVYDNNPNIVFKITGHDPCPDLEP